MLTRAILLVLLIAASVYGWNMWRGPKLLRVPLVWTSMSRRHADLAEALRLRTSIGRLLLQAKDLRAERILKEVDLVISSLVQLAKVRDSRGLGAEGDENKNYRKYTAIIYFIVLIAAFLIAAIVSELR